MQPMLDILLGEAAIGEAMATPRADIRASDGAVLVEASAPDGTLAGLRRRGQPIQTVPDLGRAAVIFCLWDRASSSFCTAAADPRGAGLAFTVEG